MSKEKTCYYVVQEGGSSGELYLHSFNRFRDAERYRRSCARVAYRTSPIGVLPRRTLDKLQQIDDRELFEAMFDLTNMAQEVDYP